MTWHYLLHLVFLLGLGATVAGLAWLAWMFDRE